MTGDISNQDFDRKRLTFEQAEMAAPLPAQLKLAEISQELRALLWAIMYEQLHNALQYPSMGGGPWFSEPWKKILIDKHVTRDHLMIDEFPAPKLVMYEFKELISNGHYIDIFGALQWIIRHRDCPSLLDRKIDRALVQARSPYRVVERTIMPTASQAEAEAIVRVFANPTAREFNGARAHVQKAGELLTSGDWASSIRESVHAVEAMVRLLEPGCKLDVALTRLEVSKKIHPALKAGFLKIYGFTSDEQGIRHPLLEQESAAVDEADALFMLGACASFVTYLVGKGRQADVIA